MAARKSSTFATGNQTPPPDPYSADPWSWAFVLFRPIPEILGCGIDTDGNAWTCRRIGGHPAGSICYDVRWRKSSVVRGYKQLNLGLDGKRRQFLVHRLVLEAFIGPCPPGMECLHKNGNRFDNRLSNLRWGTRRENVRDAISHGVFSFARGFPKGIRTIGVRLTEDQAREIKSLHSRGVSQAEIARRMGLSLSSVTHVVNRRTWKHINV